MFADLAVSLGGVWNRTQLERVIDGKEEGDFTGRYRQMCNGRVPYDSTCKKIQRRLKRYDIYERSVQKWRFHPYWALLYIKRPGHQNVKKCLTTVKIEIQQLLYKNPRTLSESDYIFKRKEVTPELISSIADHADFDALATITALSRESHHDEYSWIRHECAKQTRKIFSRVVCNTPQLFIRWPILIQYYIEPIWFIEPYISRQSLRIYDLEGEILEDEKLARARGIPLPSRHEFRQINSKELKLVQETYKYHWTARN